MLAGDFLLAAAEKCRSLSRAQILNSPIH